MWVKNSMRSKLKHNPIKKYSCLSLLRSGDCVLCGLFQEVKSIALQYGQTSLIGRCLAVLSYSNKVANKLRVFLLISVKIDLLSSCFVSCSA